MSATYTLGPDTEPPGLDVHSTPQKGAAVKPADTIAVKIEAQEIYTVHYASWQTGVKFIQLWDDAGKVDGKDYGPDPLPCDRKSWAQTFESNYKVPANPPPIVHLTARTEDYAHNKNSKIAEFPTGDWYGTIKMKGRGNVYDEEGEMDFAFSEGPDGTLSGRAHFRRTANRPHDFRPCTYTRKYSADEIDLPITGQREGDQFVVDTNLKTAKGTVTFGGGCPGGGRAVPTNILAAFSAIAAHARMRAEDGAETSYHYETPGDAASSLVASGSSIIHEAKK